MGTGHFDSSKTSQNDLSPLTHGGQNDAERCRVHLLGANVKDELTNIGASVIMDSVILSAIVRDFYV